MGEPASPDLPALEPEARAMSNAVVLSVREWLGIALVLVPLLLFLPALWANVEEVPDEPDFRMPYEWSSDYWLCSRCARRAADKFDSVLIGDSVVWGQYVRHDQTLSHYLNAEAGAERFANLGLDGAHPAALAGLVEYYADSIKGKLVILQCNLLWMSSPRHDLQEDKPFRFNHAALVPQFSPRIPCYEEEISRKLGIVVERNLPLNQWTTHLQGACYQSRSMPAWSLEHPYDNPLTPLTEGLQLPPDRLRHEPISWTDRKIKPQDFAWVDPATSIQWRHFRRAVEILKARGNRVFVLVGPFNEHMMTAKARPGYDRLKQAITAWLNEQDIPCWIPPPLASDQYADASHPLAPGYQELARQLLAKLGSEE